MGKIHLFPFKSSSEMFFIKRRTFNFSPMHSYYTMQPLPILPFRNWCSRTANDNHLGLHTYILPHTGCFLDIVQSLSYQKRIDALFHCFGIEECLLFKVPLKKVLYFPHNLHPFFLLKHFSNVKKP